jgi:uncharacterized protein involved in exopolysaccharide biosynthesis
MGGQLSTSEDPLVSEGPGAQDFNHVPVGALWSAVVSRRPFLLRCAVLGLLIATGVAFLIPNEYRSTAQLLPPEGQGLSGASMLGALAGGASALIPSGAAGLLNSKTAAGTAIGILSSRTVQDEIVKRFDLRRVYSVSLYVDARKKLAERTSIAEDKKSGLITIIVMDHNRERSRDIAAAYIQELDTMQRQLSTSSARQERIFLEGRLKVIKSDLDTAAKSLSEFSSRNATLDVQKQGQVTVEAAARLQGELITAQSELHGLQATYTDDNIRVREVRARLNELQSELRKLGGEGQPADNSQLGSNELFPSLRKLPILGVTYLNLYQQLTIQATLYEILTKQYELAKVQEAKEIPTIKILDQPELPEKKSFPPRSILVVGGTVLFTILGAGWVVGRAYWLHVRAAHPEKSPLLTLFASSNERDQVEATD